MNEVELNQLLAMMETDGWRVLMKDVENNLTATKENVFDYAKENDVWHFERGRVFQLKGLLNLENFVQNSLDQLIVEQDADETFE